MTHAKSSSVYSKRCGVQGTRHEHPMRTDKTIFVDESVTNITVHHSDRRNNYGT